MADHYFTTDPKSTAASTEFEFEFGGEKLYVKVDAGVFSATKLDGGTRVLLSELAKHRNSSMANEGGAVLDIGCGWGAISIALATKYPKAIVYGIDVNQRAIANTRHNAERNGLSQVQALEPDAVGAELEFSEIWSNPPIRIGKTALHQLLDRWLPRLSLQGTATLVVAKKLGAESLLRWLDAKPSFRCEKLDQDKGFWLLRVTREG